MDSIVASNRRPAPRLARPAERYWKGKLPKGIDAAQDGSESEDEAPEQEETYLVQDVPLGVVGENDDEEGPLRSTLPAKYKQKAMNVALKDVQVSSEGRVTVAGRLESGKTKEEEAEESPEESSSEYESDEEEEEEEIPKVQFRPVFVPKRQRATVLEREKESEFSEENIKRRENQEAARKQASHDLVGDSIRRELDSKAAEKPIQEVDDSDGLDPEAEFEAWRLRELGRIKRIKEEELKMELEREEVEKRRALPQEQRDKEDMEHAAKLREAKPKGQQKFLQKYYHKGAFHQDAEVLKRHDYTAPTQSTIDVAALPKAMQKRDWGKRSQTKYTHLLDQDTTQGNGGFGGVVLNRTGGGKHGQPGSNLLCYHCGGPHLKRDCPTYVPPLQGLSDSRRYDRTRKPSSESGGYRQQDDDNGWDRSQRRRSPEYDGRMGKRLSDSRRRRSRDRSWDRLPIPREKRQRMG